MPNASSAAPDAAARSKTFATWLAVGLGVFGVHRFYLHGLRDRWGWLFPLPTLLGLAGVQRLRAFGQDDPVTWVLLPVLGLMVSIAMLSAIVIGLTPDEKWQARFGHPGPTRWGPVLGVILALMLGGVALMSTIAFGGYRFFEWQAATEAAATPK